MKAFLIDAGEQQIVDDYIDGYPIWYIGRLINIFFAETRGQARAYATCEWNMDFTEKLSIKVLPGDYDMPVCMLPEYWGKGYTKDYDQIWNKAWHYAALKEGCIEIDCSDCDGAGCDMCFEGKRAVDKDYDPEKVESYDSETG